MYTRSNRSNKFISQITNGQKQEFLTNADELNLIKKMWERLGLEQYNKCACLK